LLAYFAYHRGLSHHIGPFDGRKEPRIIRPMWPGIEQETCLLLGGRDNH
jgi:hypothetical protein